MNYFLDHTINTYLHS